MSDSKRHHPPPTRYAPKQAQAKGLLDAAGRGASGAPLPPSTKFGAVIVQPRVAPACCAAHAVRHALSMPPNSSGHRNAVIQRAAPYGKEPPPGQSLEYYRAGFQFHTDECDMDVADVWGDAVERVSGRAIGQTLGTQESDNYDASYVDIPQNARPAAPAALWANVYAGLTVDPSNPGRLIVNCGERGDGAVQVDAATKCEIGTNKRPPMCHKVPYNHIRWAGAWLFNNKAHPSAQGYTGPDVVGYDAATWKSLVWDLSNLHPGHAHCNSVTAGLAVGAPSTPTKEAAVITYVVSKLKVLQPTWF